jgi:hypothetical protein
MPFKSSSFRAEEKLKRVAKGVALKAKITGALTEVDDAATHTLWVGHLPANRAEAGHVTLLFQEYGEIINVTVRDKQGERADGSGKSWALVSYADPDAVTRAACDSHTTNDGEGDFVNLKVVPADPLGHLQRGNTVALAAVWRTHCSIWVGRIPTNSATGANLKAIFNKYGPIEKLHVGESAGGKTSNAWAVVTFKTPGAVQRATSEEVVCLDVDSGLMRQLQVLRADLGREIESVNMESDAAENNKAVAEGLDLSAAVEAPATSPAGADRPESGAGSPAGRRPVLVTRKTVGSGKRIYYRVKWSDDTPEQVGHLTRLSPHCAWAGADGRRL